MEIAAACSRWDLGRTRGFCCEPGYEAQGQARPMAGTDSPS